MIICEVVGSIWATKKDDSMGGAKLMMVKQIDYLSDMEWDTFVAADIVGAGIHIEFSDLRKITSDQLANGEQPSGIQKKRIAP